MVESELERQPAIEISPEQGYTMLQTESVSSKVFERDGMIYKLNGRNSLIRQRNDLLTIRRRLAAFADHIPQSRVVPARHQGIASSCVIQPKIQGSEIKNVPREKIAELLKNDVSGNKAFVTELLNYFFSSIEQRMLYPDIVGYPEDPDFFNSINILLEEGTDSFKLCDVGLSPHENTLSRLGTDFYQSMNVQLYVRKMREFQNFLRDM